MTDNIRPEIVMDHDHWYQSREFTMAHYEMFGKQQKAFDRILEAFPDAAGISLPVLVDEETGLYLAMISDGNGSYSTRQIVGVNGHDPKVLYESKDLPHRPGIEEIDGQQLLTYQKPLTAEERMVKPGIWEKMEVPLGDNVIPFPVREQPLEERVVLYAGGQV